MCTRTLSLGPFFFSLLECLSDCSGVGFEIAGVLHRLPPPYLSSVEPGEGSRCGNLYLLPLGVTSPLPFCLEEEDCGGYVPLFNELVKFGLDKVQDTLLDGLNLRSVLCVLLHPVVVCSPGDVRRGARGRNNSQRPLQGLEEFPFFSVHCVKLNPGKGRPSSCFRLLFAVRETK